MISLSAEYSFLLAFCDINFQLCEIFHIVEIKKSSVYLPILKLDQAQILFGSFMVAFVQVSRLIFYYLRGGYRAITDAIESYGFKFYRFRCRGCAHGFGD